MFSLPDMYDVKVLGEAPTMCEWASKNQALPSALIAQQMLNLVNTFAQAQTTRIPRPLLQCQPRGIQRRYGRDPLSLITALRL